MSHMIDLLMNHKDLQKKTQMTRKWEKVKFTVKIIGFETKNTANWNKKEPFPKNVPKTFWETTLRKLFRFEKQIFFYLKNRDRVRDLRADLIPQTFARAGTTARHKQNLELWVSHVCCWDQLPEPSPAASQGAHSGEAGIGSRRWTPAQATPVWNMGTSNAVLTSTPKTHTHLTFIAMYHLLPWLI